MPSDRDAQEDETRKPDSSSGVGSGETVYWLPTAEDLPDPFPGEFRLRALPQQGAFGHVWLADDLYIGRPVALKSLRLSSSSLSAETALAALRNRVGRATFAASARDEDKRHHRRSNRSSHRGTPRLRRERLLPRTARRGVSVIDPRTHCSPSG